ncbi:MAG: DsbA family protein [Acidimicrobiales bacterium]
MTVIDVYADIWCPFTHVGLKRLVEQRAARGDGVTLRVRPWPLELVNGKPMDAHFIGEEVDDLREQAAGDLFSGFDVEAFPTTTLPALALVESAYRIGDAEGERLSLALRDALFEEGRDISDPHVLNTIADAAGLPPAIPADTEAVLAEWEQGKERGVVGSPHFFTEHGAFFCPALDIKRVDGHLRIAPDLPAFETFVEACFA